VNIFASTGGGAFLVTQRCQGAKNSRKKLELVIRFFKVSA